MRRLPVAIVVSMIGHGAALGWVAHDGDALFVPLRSPLAAPATSSPLAVTATSEPMSVVLLDAPDARDARDAPAPAHGAPDRDPSEAAAPAGSPAGAAQPRREAIATTTTGPELPRSEPGRSPWMTMRGAERPPPGGLSSRFLERFLENSKPLAPPPDVPGERLGDELTEARRQLRHAEHMKAEDLGQLRQRVAALAQQRAAEELTGSGGGTHRSDKETFTATVDADGQTHLKDKPEKLDTQDWIMLGLGIDPYARAKLGFLDRTRDQRAAVGERHRRVQLARAAELMQHNIDRLWATTTELAARKRGLFELWDDCAESGSDELVTAGTAARTLVLGVIRARLRGADAYTAAELAELNAHRRSTAVFAPYE